MEIRGVLQRGLAASTAGSSHRLKAHIWLVCADGSVREITEAMTATAALSQDDSVASSCKGGRCSSSFLICDSAALRVGKRACPMHPEAQLEHGRLYYVLPIPAFQYRLPWSFISCLAAMATAPASTAASAPASLPLSSRRTLTRIPLFSFLLRRLRQRGVSSKVGRTRRVDDAENRAAAGRSSGAANASAILNLQTSRAIVNVCHNLEARSKYVEQLIDRSKSWRPPLLTIHESV